MKRKSRLAVLLAAVMALVTLLTSVAFATAATELNATRNDVEVALSAEEVQAQLVYNQLLECTTLESVFSTMMLEENRTGMYALNEEQLNGLYQFVQNMYAAIAEPTEDDTYYYNDIVETLTVIAEGNGAVLLASTKPVLLYAGTTFISGHDHLHEAIDEHNKSTVSDTIIVQGNSTETGSRIIKRSVTIKAKAGTNPVLTWSAAHYENDIGYAYAITPQTLTGKDGKNYNTDTKTCLMIDSNVTVHLGEKGSSGTLTFKANESTHARIIKSAGNLYVHDGTVITGGYPQGWNVNINGSGVYVYSGKMYMDGGLITKNKSINGGGTDHCKVGGGGGVFVGAAATFEFSGGTISYNEAGSGGGGGILVGKESKLNMTGGIVDNNKTDVASGGGIGVQVSSEVTISGGTVSNNYAVNAGGGLFARGDSIPLKITGGTFNNNTAGQSGGGVLFWTVGDDVDKNTVLIGGNVKITNNKALRGGGVSVGREVIDDKPIGTKAKLIIQGNPQITGNSATTYGGGIHMQSDEFSTAVNTVEISGGNISSNSAVDGGGIYVPGGTVTMTGGTFSNNTASGRGAGIFTGGGTMTISAGSFSANIAAGNGGGAFVQGGNIIMQGGSFTGNKAVSGGAAYVNNGSFTLSNGSINTNTATSNGGALYIIGGNFTMKHGVVNGNSAKNGGAVYITKAEGGADPVVTIESGKMNNNTASVDGGAIYATSGTVKIGLKDCPGSIRDDDGTITDENAAAHKSRHSSCGISGCSHPEIKGNTAQDQGGGVATFGNATVHFYCGNATGNTALNKGLGMNVFMYGGEFHYYVGTNVGVPHDPDLVIVGGKLYDERDLTSPNIALKYFSNNTDSTKAETLEGLSEENKYINLPDGDYFFKPPQTDYVFVGWTAKGFGTNQIVRDTEDYLPSGTSIKVNDTKDGAKPSITYDGIQDNTLNLYAIWAPAKSTITYVDKLTSAVITGTPAEYTLVKAASGSKLTISAVEKSGYQLVGWYVYQNEGKNANWGYEYDPDYTSEMDKTYRTLDYEQMVKDGQYYALTTPDTDLTLDIPAFTFGDITLVADFVPAYTDLKITKTGANETLDENVSFIFCIEATNLKNTALSVDDYVFNVVVKGNGTVQVDNLPVGTYEVTEETWSWRYSPEGGATKTVELSDPETASSVTFNNIRVKDKWLDDESSVVNFTSESAGND